MRIRGSSEETETRNEMREMAEALSLFGSAMRHMARRRDEEMRAQPGMAEARAGRSARRGRLVFTPALAAAVTVAMAIPVWSHFHREATARRHPPAVQTNTEARMNVSDTVLMNQIDSDVSEEVPDALEPLAQLSEQPAATKNPVLEKKNGSQK